VRIDDIHQKVGHDEKNKEKYNIPMRKPLTARLLKAVHNPVCRTIKDDTAQGIIDGKFHVLNTTARACRI